MLPQKMAMYIMVLAVKKSKNTPIAQQNEEGKLQPLV